MGVPHNLYRTEEQQGEEFYGPIDGVKPEDYRESYPLLSFMKCLTPLRGQIYSHQTQGIKICGDCYENECAEGLRARFVAHSWHVMQKFQHVKPDCEICGHLIFIARPAERCTECIEEYLEASPLAKIQMTAGKEIDVITRW